jgi:hypothetical protein
LRRRLSPFILATLLLAVGSPAPAAPGSDSAVPGNDTAAPGNDTAAPGSNTAAPGSDTAAPGSDTAAPGSDTAVPGSDTAVPDGDTAQAEPGAELTVYLATFGPGDAVWEKFGHNAIWIHDAVTGSTISYNYGIFDFNQADFIPRLMKGSMLYSMGVRSAEDDVASYTWANRSITTQRLNLTAEQKHALREFLEWNWRPENRDYVYDYFRDNCSTRLRDALDRVLGGQIRTGLSAVAVDGTYRSHSLRLTAASPATFTGLLLGLGLPTDRPLSAWEEGFIPMELMRHLRSQVVADAQGIAVPLVLEEQILFEARRPQLPARAPARVGYYAVIGIVLAAIMIALSRAAATRRRMRLALAVTISAWGVALGFFGTILLLLWLFTDHTAAYPNFNLLLVNPLGWMLAVVAPLSLLATRRADGTGRSGIPAPVGEATGERPETAAQRFHSQRLAWPTALLMLILAVIGLVLAPFVMQYYAPLIALLLPVHAAVVLCLYQGRRRPMSPEEDRKSGMSLQAAA